MNAVLTMTNQLASSLTASEDLYGHPANLDAEASRLARELGRTVTGPWTALRRSVIYNIYRHEALGLGPVDEIRAEKGLVERQKTRDELSRLNQF